MTHQTFTIWNEALKFHNICVTRERNFGTSVAFILHTIMYKILFRGHLNNTSVICLSFQCFLHSVLLNDLKGAKTVQKQGAGISRVSTAEPQQTTDIWERCAKGELHNAFPTHIIIMSTANNDADFETPHLTDDLNQISKWARDVLFKTCKFLYRGKSDLDPDCFVFAEFESTCLDNWT